MSSQHAYRPIQTLIVLGAISAFFFWKTAAPGPLELSQAETLMAKTLQWEAGSASRVDAIAPDGEPVLIPITSLKNITAKACPELSSRGGTLSGRYGDQTRSYGAASFQCLLIADGPSPWQFHLGLYVFQSDDPSMPQSSGGFATQMLHPKDTLALMRELAITPDPISADQQSALWADLAKHDIYVPADKTQKSPLQKAMDAHKQSISTE